MFKNPFLRFLHFLRDKNTICEIRGICVRLVNIRSISVQQKIRVILSEETTLRLKLMVECTFFTFSLVNSKKSSNFAVRKRYCVNPGPPLGT